LCWKSITKRFGGDNVGFEGGLFNERGKSLCFVDRFVFVEERWMFLEILRGKHHIQVEWRIKLCDRRFVPLQLTRSIEGLFWRSAQSAMKSSNSAGVMNIARLPLLNSDGIDRLQCELAMCSPK
jgi:hypothetical protein